MSFSFRVGLATSSPPACAPPAPCPPACPPACRRIFQSRWALGEPIIVRGMVGQMGWTPEGMARVCKESGKTRMEVTDCSDFSRTSEITVGGVGWGRMQAAWGVRKWAGK